jgi:Domain of unknown function (DUF4166)/Saccharopine dehydrogenase NADP binding domain
LNRRILVLGGYGVFGARVAMGLVQDGWDVVVAGRDIARATAQCAVHGGVPMALDMRAGDFAGRVAALAPFAVVDAVGPFQRYAGYAVVRAAIAAGAHYLDLSDDAGFTGGIATLDAAAKAAGVVVLSGVSSVPALSSAAVVALMDGLTDIHSIDSVILPGNRAPRGLSVIRAILAQAGQPLTIWREGPATAKGWSQTTRISLTLPGQALPARPASLIGAPDLTLFPAYFNARNVTFRAGLELGIMHHGLTCMSLPVRWGVLHSIAGLAKPLQGAANLLKPFGTDQGGMRVRVAGIGPGGPVRRDWTLIAGAGDGPHIPAIPARVMVARLADTAPGARACLAEFPLQAAELVMAQYQIRTGIAEAAAPFLFEPVVAGYAALPAAVKDLHAVMTQRRWQGRARVTRGRGLLARSVAGVMRFPPETADTPLTVTMERQGDAEVWVRDFAGRKFRSTLRLHKGRMTERFGLLRFAIALHVQDGALYYPVTKGWFCGVPIPRWALPRSDTAEGADGLRATFDVGLSLPLIGPIVRYQGWLEPVAY